MLDNRLSGGHTVRDLIHRFHAVIVLLFLAGLPEAIVGCKAQPGPLLSGRITPAPEWKKSVYLIRPRRFPEFAANFLGQVIDSAALGEDGRFAFRNLSLRPEGEWLQLVLVKPGARFATQLFDDDPSTANYMLLVLHEAQPLRLRADAAHFQESFVIEAPDSDNRALLALRDIRIAAFRQAQRDLSGLTEDSLLIEKQVVERRYRKALMDFADTTTSLAAALLACRWIAPDGDYEQSAEFIVRQCRLWSAAAPAHPLVAQLCEEAQPLALPVLIGDTMPDMVMPLITGALMPLSHLRGTRLTLVDFWASWCAPCRRENREILVPLYRRFRDQGFAIVGYALESEKNAWSAAVERDGAEWPQASHLAGDEGPIMEAVRLTTIPANFLLDASGRVVAKNIHGQELVRFVEAWME